MKWVYEPTTDHVLDVAENLRQQDIQEVILSHGCNARIRKFQLDSFEKVGM